MDEGGVYAKRDGMGVLSGSGGECWWYWRDRHRRFGCLILRLTRIRQPNRFHRWSWRLKLRQSAKPGADTKRVPGQPFRGLNTLCVPLPFRGARVPRPRSHASAVPPSPPPRRLPHRCRRRAHFANAFEP